MHVGRKRDDFEYKVLEVEGVGVIGPSRRCISYNSECDGIREFALEELVEALTCSSRGAVQSLHRQLPNADDVIPVVLHHHILVVRHHFR